MDIKVKIKEEPNVSLTQVKPEPEEVDGFHSETVFVASLFVKESPNNSEMCNKIEIKEEPHWSETISSEIKQEMELPSAADVDLKNEIKEISSDTEVLIGDVAAGEASRLHTNTICGNSDSLGEYTRGNSDPNFKHQQIFEEPKTNCALDSDVKDNSVIQSCKMPHMPNVCGKSNRLLSTLKSNSMSNEEKILYWCEICEKSFIARSSLKRHKLTHEGKGLHTCKICEKSFSQASYLKNHLLAHKGKSPHTCEICKKSFVMSSHLTRHKLIHEDKTQLTCEICKKTFTLPSYLKRHKLTHEGKKEHVCEICGYCFTAISSLKRHKSIHEEKI